MAKVPSESEVVCTQIVYPDDTNPMGILNGGRIIEWMDTSCAICAQLHTGLICVSAAIDGVSFARPAKLGDIISVQAKVTRAFRRSLEIRTQAEVIEASTARRVFITEAYFTFVTADREVETITEVLAETPEEKLQYEEAERRRKLRQSARAPGS